MKKVLHLAVWFLLGPLFTFHAQAHHPSQDFDGFCLSIFDGMSLTKSEQTRTNAAGASSFYQYAPGMYSIGIDAFCSKPLHDWIMGVGASWTYNFNHEARVTGTAGEQTMHKKNDVSAYVKVGYAVPRILFYVRSGYISTPFAYSYSNKTETSQGILAACGLDIKLLDNLVFGLDVGCSFYRKLRDEDAAGTVNTFTTQSLSTQLKIGWLF
jgi:hypothetical protein